MSYTILLVAHIAVLGYWLGSELVINSEYRFICTRDDLPFAARDAMTDHLMDVDQHVRYALILQLTLGSMLSAELGYLPATFYWVGPLLGTIWLALVEITHRTRGKPLGQRLAMIDRMLRYAVLLTLAALVAGLLPTLPLWLRIKLGCFAGVIICGVAIRFWLIRHFRVWEEMRQSGPTVEGNAVIKSTYTQATATLLLLWAFIVAATLLAVFKP
jgi:hypothetical protein